MVFLSDVHTILDKPYHSWESISDLHSSSAHQHHHGQKDTTQQLESS